MKKFIPLIFVIPTLEENKKLVGLRLKHIYVNVDNISHFEEVHIPYPQKTDDDDNYYAFHNNVRDRELLNNSEIWDTSTLAFNVSFERLHLHSDKCISGFDNLGFMKGVRIHFKSGVNPVYKENNPVYAMNAISDFNIF
ncbi:TPA: hypothetical protein RNX31_002152 [Pasteurella multocida]|nr:hypothetical protein [Pasteurella multocida]